MIQVDGVKPLFDTKAKGTELSTVQQHHTDAHEHSPKGWRGCAEITTDSQPGYQHIGLLVLVKNISLSVITHLWITDYTLRLIRISNTPTFYVLRLNFRGQFFFLEYITPKMSSRTSWGAKVHQKYCKFSNWGATPYRSAPPFDPMPSGFLYVFGHISVKNCPIFIL